MSDFESPRVREGLPPTYRMRAESHYVDLLETRTSSARDGVSTTDHADDRLEDERFDPPPLARVSSPSTAAHREPAMASTIAVTPAFNDPTLHAGRDLAQAMTTLSACADLLNGSQSELSRTVVGNLVRAEAWRASTLVHATRVVRRELPVARTAMSVLGVLDQVVQGFAAERRLRPIVVESETELPYGSVVGGDETLVVGALAGAVMATLALVETVPNARIVVSASTHNTQLTFSVAQNVVLPPMQWQVRAFDPQWNDRPGGVPALVALLAVHETAALHGGTATAVTDARGTRIGLTIPLGV